jgi:hypothetical protein
MSYTHSKGKGAGKYNGMQKAADWDGKRVKAVRQVINGGGYGAAPGTLGTVRGIYAGLDITFDVCTHCGTVTHIGKVGYFDVELAE